MKLSFDIPVYNKEVRAAVQQGKSHPDFEDKWADIHIMTERAHTPDEAWAQCERKHPERLGFILGDAVDAL
ncbi:hypothetical protein [Pseudemcibacter aquimaris]|uniref:hypothetical protein n=1 Tax=Pseudemcibacter aquimaris TaxID=2857064 RepID=UPI0020139CDF|nr:hypothetical protein [Pseudemcibacter aquimaris]MCC3861668.1 hypothetical protein [Pseudemcibacter aquimaris]WDU58439.1 hypothetical protein KW060_14695 [Pseudemcibacter aquimaris]